MPSAEPTEAVRRRALELGFDACHCTTAAAPASASQFHGALAGGRHAEMHWLARNADKRADPQLVLPGARSIVVVAASYGEAVIRRSGVGRAVNALSPASPATDPSVADPPTASPRGVVARYARHTDYHNVLAGPLRELAAFLDTLGGPGTRSLWYVDTGPVLERDLAQRAGLGFIGKHTNLISRRLGNWFLLGEILTTLELAPGAPERNRCGGCSKCLTACPTQALPAPFTLDARRCISYLTIELKGSIPVGLRPLIGDRIFGCDDCLAVCPWNRFAREGALLEPHRRAELAQPDLLELLALDDVTFRARFAGTPLVRTKRRGLLRNVCVALGNVGDAASLPALQRATLEAEPLVAEHAAWAVARIESRNRPVGDQLAAG